MALHYSSGTGKIYDKDTTRPIANINYQLIETERTKYSAKKWWGEFSATKPVKRMGDYIIELGESRRGLCYISANDERASSKTATHHYYRFYGRGKLGK